MREVSKKKEKIKQTFELATGCVACMEVETMLKFYYIVAKGVTLRQGGRSEEWFGGTRRRPLSLMEKTRM